MKDEIRRNPDGSIDEIVAGPCYVHLERMDTNEWSLILSRGDGREILLTIGAKRAPVTVFINDDQMIEGGGVRGEDGEG